MVDLGYVNGKRRRKAVFGKTEREVSAKLKPLLADQQRGLAIPIGRQTVAEYMDRWLATVAKHRLAISTHEAYVRNTRLHIVPHIGRVQLAKLTPAHLSKLYTMLIEGGLSKRSTQYVHAILHTALKQAARERLIAHNPADDLDPPRPDAREIAPLTPEQAAQFLRAIVADRLFALYLLAIATTLRQGEILGLKWADVNWERGTLLVVRKVGRTKATGLAFGELKSRKGRRTLALPPIMLDVLRQHRTAQDEARLAAEGRWHDHDLIFPNGIGRPMERQNLIRRSFHGCLVQAGLPLMPFHTLRHSAATLLIALQVHMKVVQQQMGHSVIATTMNTYGHVTEGMQREVADKLEVFFRSAFDRE